VRLSLGSSHSIQVPCAVGAAVGRGPPSYSPSLYPKALHRAPTTLFSCVVSLSPPLPVSAYDPSFLGRTRCYDGSSRLPPCVQHVAAPRDRSHCTACVCCRQGGGTIGRLFRAVSCDNVAEMLSLMTEGAVDVNDRLFLVDAGHVYKLPERRGSATLLHLAASVSAEQCVAALLGHGASADIADAHGLCPHAVAKSEHVRDMILSHVGVGVGGVAQSPLQPQSSPSGWSSVRSVGASASSRHSDPASSRHSNGARPPSPGAPDSRPLSMRRGSLGGRGVAGQLHGGASVGDGASISATPSAVVTASPFATPVGVRDRAMVQRTDASPRAGAALQVAHGVDDFNIEELVLLTKGCVPTQCAAVCPTWRGG
jgi:hypothetical protein